MSALAQNTATSPSRSSRKPGKATVALLLLAGASGCGLEILEALDDDPELTHSVLQAEYRDSHERPSKSLQAALDKIVERGAPGAIAYSRHGSHVQNAVSGVSNLEKQSAISVRDRFRGGSTGKSFTATVVLQLVGEHRLQLDDTLERWLPGIMPRGADITVRQLLNHSSGIAHNAHDAAMTGPYMAGDREHYWSPRELVAFSAARPLAFEPGSGYLYSNTNYHLLGLIIEAVTKRDAIAEIERRLLRPLKLEHSYFAVDPQIRGRHTHGYHFGPEFVGGVDTTVFSPSWAWTAGALVTTVGDLARFNRALFAGELLQPDEMLALLTTVAADEGRSGLGVAQWQTPCGPGWGHEGDFPGYHTFAIISLDGSRQAVVHINSDDAIGIGLADPDLARAVFAAFCSDAR
jgi:D-alanyl-D-alanine carboxypeptidase